MFMPRTPVMSADQEREIVEIFSTAAKAPKVGEWCRKEYGQHIVISHPVAMKQIFDENKTFWRKQGQLIGK
jgi:hypothetical protein